MEKKKVAAKKVAKKSGQFIVIWDDNDGDPVKVFNSRDEAVKFIKDQLIENVDENYDYVDKSSIRLFSATLIGKPKVVVTFE